MGSPVVVASPRKSPSYNRRANKPLVEKKRRARINGCLSQLKSLILGAMQTEGAQVSRLEKADILEMTVKYLQHMQHQQLTSEPEVVTKFSAGYTECASEVIRYIGAVNCVSPDVRAKLENHLVERLRGSMVQAPAAQNAVMVSQQNTKGPAQLSTVNTFTSSNVTANIPPTRDTYLQSTDVDSVSSYMSDIDIANKAAAEALKRPQQAAPNTSRVSVTGIRQALQAAPVSPRNCSPKNELPAEELLNALRARQESRHNHVVHPVPLMARSQSTSPPHARHSNELLRATGYASERERHSSSSESSVQARYTPPSAYTHQAFGPAAYNHEAYISNSMDIQLNTHAIKNESDAYLSDFERPLHIHIPDSPRVPSTPSPHFYPQGVPYHSSSRTQEVHTPLSPSNYSADSMDESPPTILYGYQQQTTPVYKMETEESFLHQDNRNNIRFQEYGRDAPYAPFAYKPSVSNVNNSRATPQDDFQLSKRTIPATPSPPMLTKEEPLSQHGSRSNHTGSYCQDNRSLNEHSVPSGIPTHHSYTRELAQYNNENVDPNDRNQYSHHAHRDGQYCDQVDVKSKQSYLPEVSNYQLHNSEWSSNACIQPEPQAQVATHNKNLHNEQPVVNEPAPHLDVQSRLKDTALSQLTLKRRILYGLGSEGEWTASGKIAKQLQEQNTCAQNNGRQSMALPTKEKDLIAPSDILCRRPSQCGSDEALWRPW
uniref:BHLH domain-containing protein n=1 Tax=Biomphalaria glabrata TaxID=6526 RepID=A0A2C9JYE0_BIOGL